MKLSALLKSRREARTLSRPEVVSLLAADGVEVSVHALEKWEQGQRTPKQEALRALCHTLRITPEEVGEAMIGDAS